MRLRLLVCLAFVATFAFSQSRPRPRAATGAAAAACQVGDDTAYTQQIKHNTTLPNFITNLVDHLPSNSCVPSPETWFGHIIGAPGILDHTDKLNGYLRLLASKSGRIKVFSLGMSEEGREMVVAVISDEDTIANLDRYKQITARLADPRGLSDAEAQTLVNQGKPIYWATGSIHSSETGSPEMLMELAYRLVADEDPFIQAIRKNEIVMITPLVETDGHDREVDIFEHREQHADEPTPGLLWWGHYVAHDDNRDGMTLSLALSRNIMTAYLDYHPTVLHDLHESQPFLYISTGGGPYNAWLDPMQIDEWHQLAYNEIDEMTKRGVIGVFTHTYYDGWAPNYLFFIANNHNAIGRFYETQSAPGGGDTGPVTVAANGNSREWYRPNPALPSVIWSLRDNINMQESALLFGMNNVAVNKQHFLDNFYVKSKRAVAKAHTEGPAAWLFPGDDPRPYQQARILDQFQAQGVEVHRADGSFNAGGRSYPAGTYIVRMDQPYSRLVDMFLDKQYYSPDDPRPYDDTGWSQGPLADIETVPVRDLAVLSVPMTKLSAPVAPPSGVNGGGSVYLVNANADANLATFRFALAQVPMAAAEQPFDAAGRHFNAGSFIISGADGTQVAAQAKAAGVQVYAVDAAPSVPTHPLQAPRVALMHNWQSTQNDGWYRIALDQLKVPYTYIADTKVRETPDLRSQFDAIIVPPSIGGDLPSIIHGLEGPRPIPYMNTPEMPDLVSPGLDSTSDERGGLGMTGVIALERFVNQGGLLITVGGNGVLPVETGMAEGVSLRPVPDTLIAGGGVVRAMLANPGDNDPLTYGYSPEVDVYYSAEPILTAGAAGGFGGGRGGRGGGRGGPAGRGGAVRSSGTGDLETPDVLQGRSYDLEQQAREAAGRGANGTTPPGGLDEGATPFTGGAGVGRGGRGGRGGGGVPPRVAVRFAAANQLPISGLLQGGEAIADQPAVLSVKYGQGYVVMFGANPMWRNGNSGEYALVLNALMNYDHLDAGATAGGRGAGRGQR